jgi:hypothetical protein
MHTAAHVLVPDEVCILQKTLHYDFQQAQKAREKPRPQESSYSWVQHKSVFEIY